MCPASLIELFGCESHVFQDDGCDDSPYLGGSSFHSFRIAVGHWF